MQSKLRPVIRDLADLLAALPAVCRYLIRRYLARTLFQRALLRYAASLLLFLLEALPAALARLRLPAVPAFPSPLFSLPRLPKVLKRADFSGGDFAKAGLAGAALVAMVAAVGLPGGEPDEGVLPLAGTELASAAPAQSAPLETAPLQTAAARSADEAATAPVMRTLPVLPPDLEAEQAVSRLSVSLAALQPVALTLPDVQPAPPLNSDRLLTVRRGDTLTSLLLEAGVDGEDAHRAITAMSDIFSPRALRPGQEVRLALAAELPSEQGSAEGGERLLSLVLQPDPERDIKVTRIADSGEYLAEAVARPLTLAISRGAGVIETSLFEAGLAAEVPLPVTIDAIRLFSYDVDFQREMRKGDAFEFLYESRFDSEGRLAKTGDLLFASLTVGGRQLDAYRFTDSEGDTDYFDAKGESLRKALLKTPVDGARISSTFGLRRHPILGYNKMHRGLDFAAPSGTPIYAAGNGTVERAGRNGGYGNYVRIRHNSTYKTAYAHMKSFAKGLTKGSKVKQGDVIGYVGTTGRSTGPHLHYEVLMGNKQVNPQQLDLPKGEQLEGQELKRFQAERERIDRLRRDRSIGTTQVASACGEAAKSSEAAGKTPGC